MIHIPNNSPASKFTQHKTSTLRIKDKIKYLYTKKQQLNQQLLHLLLTSKPKHVAVKNDIIVF
jgi:hypothetical protein